MIMTFFPRFKPTKTWNNRVLQLGLSQAVRRDES